MKYQRLISLTAGLSFIIIFISSGVLYFIPDRGVTGWTAWTFLGLDKQQWDNLHINLGILFLVFIVWHIYFNWKPIKAYLKVKKKWKVFTKEFNAALITTLLFAIGTMTMTQPFSFLVNIGNGIKAGNSLDDGNPPFGYAEYATLEDFCLLTHIDKKQALQRLEAKGITPSSTKSTLLEIAASNHTSPKALFLIIRDTATKFILPTDLPVGMARKSLARLQQEYWIELDKFIAHLAHYRIKATPESTFKKLAKNHNLHPAQLYNMLLASQVEQH
jgi:hypothetical protein